MKYKLAGDDALHGKISNMLITRSTSEDELMSTDRYFARQLLIAIDEHNHFTEGSKMAMHGEKIPMGNTTLGPTTPTVGLGGYNTADVAHDPWAHRSAGMRCISCMWWVPKATDLDKRYLAREIGRCRRHAPTMNRYPVTFSDDWCGDHKLDETK